MQVLKLGIVGNLSGIIEIPAFGGTIVLLPTGRSLEERVVLRQFHTAAPQKCCSAPPLARLSWHGVS